MTLTDEMVNDLLGRMAQLDTAPVHRVGTVIAIAPLSVSLGRAATPNANVQALAGLVLSVGDIVSVLVFGAGMIVLGKIAPPDKVHLTGGTGEPAFANSWVNFDATNTVRFYRTNGETQAEGVMKNGTVGATAFTFPVGYRPQIQVITPVYANAAVGFVVVTAAGALSLAIGSNAAVDLSTVRFRCVS